VTDASNPRRRQPAAEHPVRDSGPVEGARANREVPPSDPARQQLDEVADESLEQRLAAAEAEAETHLNDLKRLAAEFENYRKRVAREHESLSARAAERLVKELLPSIDDLERALEAAAEPPVRDSGPVEGVRGNREVPPADLAAKEAKLEEGVRLVHRQLASVLEREGLSEIETNGKFDPHVHEALLSQPSEAEEGSVIEVLQKGYRLGDRVLRPARVVVAGAKEEAGGDDG
jgi:molecular chaperone GrpE